MVAPAGLLAGADFLVPLLVLGAPAISQEDNNERTRAIVVVVVKMAKKIFLRYGFFIHTFSEFYLNF